MFVEDWSATVTGVSRHTDLAGHGIAVKTRLSTHVPFIVHDFLARITKCEQRFAKICRASANAVRQYTQWLEIIVLNFQKSDIGSRIRVNEQRPEFISLIVLYYDGR